MVAKKPTYRQRFISTFMLQWWQEGTFNWLLQVTWPHLTFRWPGGSVAPSATIGVSVRSRGGGQRFHHDVLHFERRSRLVGSTVLQSRLRFVALHPPRWTALDRHKTSLKFKWCPCWSTLKPGRNFPLIRQYLWQWHLSNSYHFMLCCSLKLCYVRAQVHAFVSVSLQNKLLQFHFKKIYD